MRRKRLIWRETFAATQQVNLDEMALRTHHVEALLLVALPAAGPRNLIGWAEDLNDRDYGAIGAVNEFDARFVDLVLDEGGDFDGLRNGGRGAGRLCCAPSAAPNHGQIGDDHAPARVVLVG